MDQRRKKLLKRLIATPMSTAHYLASFGLSRFIWLIFEVAMLVGCGILIFGVPLRGLVRRRSAVVSLLSAAMFGGIGLLIAARPKTIEGASGIMNLVMLPMWVFSGVFFNASNFPGRDAAVHPGPAAHRVGQRASVGDAGGHAHSPGSDRSSP